jgi:hypothetical protein
MFILSYIKNNAVKSLAAASTLALLSLLLVWIIYNFKPWYSQIQTDVSVSLSQPKISASHVPSDNSAKYSDLANDTQAIFQLLNPNAPCPPQQFSCISKKNEHITDQSCPSYKPIWAYFSNDNGASWMQVGCYATQIDATKALDKAIARGYVKNNKVINSNDGVVKSGSENKETTNSSNINPSPPTPSNNSIQDIFNNPYNRPSELEKKTEPINGEQKVDNKTEQPTHLVAANEAKEGQAATRESGGLPAEKENREERRQNMTVKFKLLFGLIPVEKRTYPNEEMREKAVILWKKEQKVLEPDGTINEKYALKNHNDDGIMHHH